MPIAIYHKTPSYLAVEFNHFLPQFYINSNFSWFHSRNSQSYWTARTLNLGFFAYKMMLYIPDSLDLTNVDISHTGTNQNYGFPHLSLVDFSQLSLSTNAIMLKSTDASQQDSLCQVLTEQSIEAFFPHFLISLQPFHLQGLSVG